MSLLPDQLRRVYKAAKFSLTNAPLDFDSDTLPWIDAKNPDIEGFFKNVSDLLKKGDILIWHAALAHGGNRIGNPELSRKSFVCHYSTVRSYPKHRFETGETSLTEYHNGITVYANPENLAEENILTKGKDW
ncbi:MAG: hypothetical protein LH606_04445 [Cytophagaceae bacterium]|nr:hypothetical protein [Cytophagaceae bacterium]